MTRKQKLEIERSTKVGRLNELLGLQGDALTDEVRNEMDALTQRMPALEIEMRAAITAEAAEEAVARGMFGSNGDGEAAETRRLMEAVTINDYLGPATAGSAIEGRAAELNAALEVSIAGPSGGVALPWAVLEARAFTATAANDGSEIQRPILQRLFGPGVKDTLGVRLDTVPSGAFRMAADHRRRRARSSERGSGCRGCRHGSFRHRQSQAEKVDRKI